MPTSLLYLAILISQASALAFRGPQATPNADVGDLLFPPEPTAAPKVHPDIFRRQDIVTDLLAPDNTCGYISGLAGAAYGCNAATDVCAFFPSTSSSYGFIGCCDLVHTSCGARLTCVDSVQYYFSSVCDNGCEKDTFTLKCTAATAPYCNGIRFPIEGVQDYFCDDTTVSTWQTAYTTYNGEDDGRAFVPVVVTLTSAEPISGTTGISFAISQSPSSEAPSQSTSSAAGSQGTAGQGDGGSGASPTTTAPIGPTTSAAPVSSSSSGAPIGAIVGGAVGGVAGLAIIAFVLYFMIRSAKKKDNAANTSNGAPPPTYVPPQDPNNQVYAAANPDKPTPSTQETPLTGQWGTGQNTYPPQMQEQQPYPPQMQQQQYPPQEQRFSQQPNPHQMQQQPYPNMAEVQGSYGQQPQQTQHQTMDPASYPQNQSSNPHYSMISAATQPSPNPQAHMSAGFPDRGDTTSPMSNRQVSELSTPGGAQAPLSPSPTFTSNMGASGPTPTHLAPEVEGRAEMSANMAGGPFPINVYEFPGSETYNH